MRRPLRSAFVLGVLAGLVLALARALAREGRPAPTPLAAPPAPLPAVTPPVRTPVPIVVTPEPEPRAELAIRFPGGQGNLIASSGETWVAPVEGECPDGHPIKAKESSGIYHRPGGLSYERTRPDRCYPDEATAEADGFRAAKR